jgi:hypothetical protein
MQNAEEVQENNRRETNFQQEHVNITRNMNGRLRYELRKDCQTQTETVEMKVDTSFQQTSDTEKEQMERQLRTAILKAEILEKELHYMRELREYEAADREYDRAFSMRRLKQMEERENLLRAVLTESLSDDSSNESEPDCSDDDDDDDDDGDDPAEEEDITEHASWYCTSGRELTENWRNPYWESQESVNERSEGDGTSSWLPGVAATSGNNELPGVAATSGNNELPGVAATSGNNELLGFAATSGNNELPGVAATSGNNETTICDGETTSSTKVPRAASMSNGSAGGQSELCPICLREFDTQEVGVPEACNHSFCAGCLQEWLMNTNTCPIDRQVCDTILVRLSLEGDVVRKIHVEPPRQQEEEDVIDYVTRCEVCGDSNRFYALINCDRCGRGYHMDCIHPRLDTWTLDEWFCSDCSDFSLDIESE